MRERVEKVVSSFLKEHKKDSWSLKVEYLPFWNRFVLQAKDVRLWVDAKESGTVIVLECAYGNLCNQLMEVGIALAKELTRQGIPFELRGGFWRFPEKIKNIA